MSQRPIPKHYLQFSDGEGMTMEVPVPVAFEFVPILSIRHFEKEQVTFLVYRLPDGIEVLVPAPLVLKDPCWKPSGYRRDVPRVEKPRLVEAPSSGRLQ